MFATRTLCLWLAVLGMTSVRAPRAEIIVGPWSFDDRAFSDHVLQLEPGGLVLWCGAIDLQDALAGYSPDRQLVNIGHAGNANDFAFVFTDLVGINEPGPDAVFFETRFSEDPYEIAVRPQGGAFTTFLMYPAADFIDTRERQCENTWGVEVEFSDFGLPEGVLVDALRIRALPNLMNVEGDPLMAGVLHGRDCATPDDSDGDGVSDGCDCDPMSAGPPADPLLFLEGDRETLRIVGPPASPNAQFRLMRGELADLRASWIYDLTCVDEAIVGTRAVDPALPSAGRPLYYLVAAHDCLGDGGLGTRSDLVERVDAGPGCPP